MENVNMGQHAAALAQFEATLRCKNDAYVISLAFMAACSAQNAAKAKLYYKKMSGAQQTKFLQLCVRNHIDPTDSGDDDTPVTVAAPKNCDADALKDKGMENVNMGQHAAALGNFEASLKCKDDNYVRSLAFMAACNAQNATKAKQHYAQLNQSQKDKFVQMCYRNRIDPETGGVYDPDGKGYLQITSKPAAKIIIDGVETGLTTPVSGKKLPLSPGKHKVTFVVGDERYTYPVAIKPGKTETMSKDLR
jgi:tetratricopeptide (TPR) repeat protein